MQIADCSGAASSLAFLDFLAVDSKGLPAGRSSLPVSVPSVEKSPTDGGTGWRQA